MMLKILCFEDGKKFSKTVKAQPIKIVGFSKFNFAIHKTSFISGILDILDGYTVSEVTTGLSIDSGCNKKEAVKAATILLKKKGVRKVQQRIKDIQEGAIDPFEYHKSINHV